MSFRRYVGKTVHITARGASGGPVEYIARLFDYDDAGIWLHHTGEVTLQGNQKRSVDGLLFLPHSQIINVFAYDGLDELMADELRRQADAGADRESAAAAVQQQRDPADKATIDSVGAVTAEELEGN